MVSLVIGTNLQIFEKIGNKGGGSYGIGVLECGAGHTLERVAACRL